MHAGPHNKVTLTALVDLAELQLERGAAAAAAETFDDALARLSTAEAQQAHGAAPAHLFSTSVSQAMPVSSSV